MGVWEFEDCELKPYLLQLAERLYAAAEPAYEEVHTVAVWKGFLEEHMIPCQFGLNGRAPIVDFGSFASAPVKVVVTADLDAVCVRQDEALVCEHTCGHYAQSVHALGLAKLLSMRGLPEHVAVRIIGCPGEECRPVYDEEYSLPYQGGKQQLLKEGWFQGASAVLSTHLADELPARALQIIDGANGLIGIRLTAPEFDPIQGDTGTLGNYAALLDAWQEELRSITMHPDLRVRARPVRTGVEFWADIPGRCGTVYIPVHEILSRLAAKTRFSLELVCAYAPLCQSGDIRGQVLQVWQGYKEQIQAFNIKWLPGATDLGDVSQRHPTFLLFVGGTAGFTHSRDFRVVDHEFALLWPVEWLWRMIQLMQDNS